MSRAFAVASVAAASLFRRAPLLSDVRTVEGQGFSPATKRRREALSSAQLLSQHVVPVAHA